MEVKGEDAVRQAMEAWPGSIHGLARAAGVSEGLLRFIRDGERSATPATLKALAEALSHSADRQSEAARILRESLTDREAP